ncbi:MAG: hypothetical protein E6Q92_02500 [Burkholderiaceae bacterium]|nr:MAG: hypothetical protein E6Q92_02500 [Burkholderiaceae bacterium]
MAGIDHTGVAPDFALANLAALDGEVQPCPAPRLIALIDRVVDSLFGIGPLWVLSCSRTGTLHSLQLRDPYA